VPADKKMLEDLLAIKEAELVVKKKKESAFASKGGKKRGTSFAASLPARAALADACAWLPHTRRRCRRLRIASATPSPPPPSPSRLTRALLQPLS
jgi:hypothetical protein